MSGHIEWGVKAVVPEFGGKLIEWSDGNKFVPLDFAEVWAGGAQSVE